MRFLNCSSTAQFPPNSHPISSHLIPQSISAQHFCWFIAGLLTSLGVGKSALSSRGISNQHRPFSSPSTSLKRAQEFLLLQTAKHQSQTRTTLSCHSPDSCSSPIGNPEGRVVRFFPSSPRSDASPCGNHSGQAILPYSPTCSDKKLEKARGPGSREHRLVFGNIRAGQPPCKHPL